MDLTSPKDDKPKEEEKLPEEEKTYPKEVAQKRAVEKINNSPLAQKYDIRVMRRKSFILMWSFVGFMALMFIIIAFVGIAAFNNKDFSPVINTPVNVDAPNVTNIFPTNHTNENVNNNNNTFTINVDIGDQIITEIADTIIAKINNETNSS